VRPLSQGDQKGIEVCQIDKEKKAERKGGRGSGCGGAAEGRGSDTGESEVLTFILFVLGR